MRPYIADSDFTLWHGDVLEVLRELPDLSVDCVVTSPPYFGLRDYGTGTWEGGEAECDHARPTTTMNHGFNERWGQGAGERKQERKSEGQYADACLKCGASRVDRQLGLERTPQEYVARLVEVFAEVRRVLSRHGTVWLNLGDSYASGGHDWYDRDEVNAGRGHARRPQTPPGLKAKDRVMVPARVALALQDDGWWLRSEIVWHKPNTMPSSVTDRPTNAHEMVYLLTRSARYFFDQEAVREPTVSLDPAHPSYRPNSAAISKEGRKEFSAKHETSARFYDPAGRNIRSVWEIATEPFPDAHFAVMPTELVRRCLLAGTSERGVCPSCRAPWERVVERGEPVLQADTWSANGAARYDDEAGEYVLVEGSSTLKHVVPTRTVGWRPTCEHGEEPTPSVVLDPFMGSGTVALVARKLGRHAVGVELSEPYCEMVARRLSQLSLLAEPA